MSKAEGQKIAIRFDRPIVGDVTGYTPTPIGGYEFRKVDTTGVIVTTLNSANSSYMGDKTIDNNLSTQWYGTTSINWIKYQFKEAFILTKLRLYMGSAYISQFNLFGSNDGVIWDQIGATYIGASSTTSMWYDYELPNTVPYLYYRIDTVTSQTSYIYLFEVEFYYTGMIGNEKYFTVTGLEFNYVPGGVTSTVTYKVRNVEPYQGIQLVANLSNADLVNLSLSLGVLTLAEGGS